MVLVWSFHPGPQKESGQQLEGPAGRAAGAGWPKRSLAAAWAKPAACSPLTVRVLLSHPGPCWAPRCLQTSPPAPSPSANSDQPPPNTTQGIPLCYRPCFPSGASSKELACQCRRCNRHRFDPWVGKIPWRRKWQRAPVFLPGESHGQRSLVGYSPQGRPESDTTDAT